MHLGLPKRRRLVAQPLTASTAQLVLLTFTTAVLLAFVFAGCGGSEAGGPSAAPTSGPPTDPGLSPEPVPSESTAGGPSGDPAEEPIVYLLGGSSARECVVGNAAWSDEMRELGAGPIEAMDLGATNRSYSQDIRYVRHMDRSRPTVVLIGINLGRYTFAPSPNQKDKPVTADELAGLAGTIDLKHRYTVDMVLSDGEKRDMLDQWLAERYELFRRYYDGNQALLAELIDACRERGFHVALVDLPMNEEIVGDRLDTPRGTYLEDCRRLAARKQIAFFSFADDIGLVNRDFYDLVHLVGPGREKWQTRLSREVVKLMRAEGLAPV